MLILNFSHPFTDSQYAQIKKLTGGEITEIRDLPAQLDNATAFAPQIRKLVDSIGLSSKEWQTRPILINPLAYNFAALTLLAELHGRMGYFPAIIRIRPIPDTTPPRYEVAEIINLQDIRTYSRAQRTGPQGGVYD